MSEDLSGFSLFELFRGEVETHTAILNEGLLALEGGQADFEPLMRAAHSLKGAARIVDLDLVVRVSHAMEDCFVGAQEGKLPHLSRHAGRLFAAVDLIARIAALEEQDLAAYFVREAESIEALTGDLERLSDPQSEAALEPEDAGQTDQQSQDRDEPPEAEIPSPARPVDGRDLRIRAENLTRLMGLAGEAVVAAGWLEQLTDSLSSLEEGHRALARHLEELSGLPHDETSSLGIEQARIELASCSADLADRKRALDRYARRSAELSSRLYREVLSGRMRPFSDGTKAFPRLVRDLAQDLGKIAHLEVRGLDTEVDRDILERLEAPLNHILRNSLDHGIEDPDSRRHKGKDPRGRVLLEAHHQGGKLVVSVSDDGAGVNPERLRERIVQRGLANQERAAEMGIDELLGFLFLPGFSTRDSVSEVSGRGVGLDVVQNMVQEVGGQLRVENLERSGCRFTLELPVTRSVLRVLLVEMAGQPFAIPMARVSRVLRILEDEVLLLESRPYCHLEGENLGLVSGRQILGLASSRGVRDYLEAVVIGDRSEKHGMVVDRFLGEREVVVQPLDPRLGTVPDVAASAIMDDGSPVLILDVDDVLRSISTLLEDTALESLSGLAVDGRPRVLIADDSPTLREAERLCLEGAGYSVRAAIDGHDAWNALRGSEFDLLVSDVDMPRLTGLQLVQRIRNDGRWKNLPIVLLSHRDRPEDRQKGLDAGADRYLSKAEDLETSLVPTVSRLLEGPSP